MEFHKAQFQNFYFSWLTYDTNWVQVDHTHSYYALSIEVLVKVRHTMIEQGAFWIIKGRGESTTIFLYRLCLY